MDRALASPAELNALDRQLLELILTARGPQLPPNTAQAAVLISVKNLNLRR